MLLSTLKPVQIITETRTGQIITVVKVKQCDLLVRNTYAHFSRYSEISEIEIKIARVTIKELNYPF